MSSKRVCLATALIASALLLTAFAGPPEPALAPNAGPSHTSTETLNDLDVQGLGMAPPMIELDRSRINFGAVAGGANTTPQTLMVSNSGAGTLDWTASASEPWIQITPSSGTSVDSVAMGVGLDLTGLGPATYTGTVTISDPLASNSPQIVDVFLHIQEGDAAPFGTIGTPLNESNVAGVVPVTGWVLDDIEVSGVGIYYEDGPDLRLVGNATLVVGARPDVEHAYPKYPNNHRAGWSLSLITHFLPNDGNGSCTLHAIATDSTGHRVTLGTKTIHSDNANAVKPFGTIDTPSPGAMVSGSIFRNMGWVLTPQPNAIPTDGSTINVYVDGAYVGHPIYNIYRSDIAALFPGYANSDGAFAYFDLDTTAYANGVHTIQWTARDDGGNTEGIGSRYFRIQNPPPVYEWCGAVSVDADYDASTPGWGSSKFASIQAGIDATLAGGTVKVKPGAYSENVTLDRYVHVSLDADVVLDGDFSISAGIFAPGVGNLVLSGNFAHFGGIFDPGDRMVTFDGGGTQIVSGDVVFHDLVVGSGVILETEGNVTVNGTLTNDGIIREIKTVEGLGPVGFSLTELAVDITEPGLTGLQVERWDRNHPNAPVAIQTGRYWRFTPTGTGFTLDMTLPHNGIPDACDEVCRYDGSSDSWDCAADGFDGDRNTITRRGIAGLSDWATGDNTAPCSIWLPMIYHP